MEVIIFLLANLFFLAIVLSILLIISLRRNEDEVDFKVGEDIKKIKEQIG